MKPDSTELVLELAEMNSSRRGFFRAVSRGVSHSMEESKVSDVNPGRPLGAVEEALFSRLCNQCGDCINACPQGVLSMGSNGPIMDLSLNHCTFCQQCISACQTQALNTLNTTDTGWRPTINQSCNARLFGNCQECVDDCPNQALTLAPNSVPSLSDNCNGCGECLSSCYIGSITLVEKH
ncbi:ferredoxin-type protein NapF [Vibrio sp. 404]|uniref:Ferredoxin-type protein NapF n=1 Tax=Vibrio marinisediminis TaxID=2758441 RepID=A0A7W2FPI5_9VIBR|nr:ferredoxin-type protein NapF [Vibrio marinisediminis]MBA5761764.1 ferredoxin-type protein NapF [Vibrio marinisediminis]